jgi:hypothetical protein
VDTESPSENTTQQPDGLAPYDVEAWRFTISLDVRAEGAVAASMLVMKLCQQLANLAVNPLGGQALHTTMAGRVLNIVCFNDATPAAGPIDPAELTKLQDVVAQLQSTPGAADALAGLLGMPPAEQNGGAS